MATRRDAGPKTAGFSLFPAAARGPVGARRHRNGRGERDRSLTKLFVLIIAAAATILVVGGIVAILMFRRETRRAEFGRVAEPFPDIPPRRRPVF